MASPLNFKAKWPSQRQGSALDMASFVPYVSNLANSFRKVPRPMAPRLIDPVAGSTISLDNARSEVGNAARAADLATRDLDPQTGAAIRVGTLSSKLRSLSDISSREAMLNNQSRMQTSSINASIDAQNTGVTNQYRDDLINARITQQREQSQNLANAADKFITQSTVQDQIDLDRDKTVIMSKMYDQGVYDRLGKRLEKDGITIPGTTPVDPFQKYKTMGQTSLPAVAGIDLGQMTLPTGTLKQLRKFFNMRNTYAAGGMLPTFTEGDPTKPGSGSPKASTSDSLAIYNNTNKVLDYYKNREYGIKYTPSNFNQLAVIDAAADIYNENEPRKVATQSGKSVPRKLPKNAYRINVDNNRFYQRETANSILDTRSPMTMYDRRIQPTGVYEMDNYDHNDSFYGDMVEIPGYDPIAIKPWNMLTPEERAIRIEKYGNPTAGTTTTVTPKVAAKPLPKPIPEVPLNPTKVRSVQPTQRGTVLAKAYQSADLTPQKTDYSATFRDEQVPSKQRTIYFKDRKAWRGFLGSGAFSASDTSENADSASATGYRTMRYGGRLKKKLTKPFA